MNLTPAQQRFLLDLARSAIVNSLRGMRTQPPQVNDPVLNTVSGCFVTLHEAASHRLRGCIGRIQSADPLVVGMHDSAISALHDPRFVNNPVTLQELPRLDLEVSVLSPLMPAANPLDFEPLEHGIFLTHQGRTGTFLPQVARETGWNREQLLTRLCGEKMGLSPDAWREPAARLFKYTALVIGPVPFVEQPTAPAGGLAGNVFRV
ncbi:MAG: AmmeMemoRadiSam system protein A [Tepidisphaerales bacterium]